MPLPLDIFRAALGLHPWHFWQFADSGNGALVPVLSKCSTLTYEYDWQGSDAAGRQSIKEAIQAAHWKMLDYVGYRPMPEYVDYATVDWPSYFVSGQYRYADYDANGQRIAVTAPEGYIQAMGIESLTLLATATVLGGELVYSALFNAGLEDTFTITVPNTTSITDTTQIAVYFSSADRFDDTDVGERWRIEPIDVAFTGGNIVIKGRKWLCGVPILYENPVAAILDPQDSANFVTSLDVYQRATDGSGTSVTTCQATLVYETNNCGACWGVSCCNTGTVSTDPSVTGEVIARAGIRDSTLGLITPAAAVYDSDADTWSSQWCCGTSYCNPDRVKLRYLAGYPLQGRQMAPRFRDPMVWLSAAELKRRICACRDTNEKLWQLQQDLTLQATETERYQLSQRDLDNPFGLRRGHIQAWKAVNDVILRRGISV